MDREHEPGQTFALPNIAWIDFETVSRSVDLKQAGAYRYACDSKTIAAILAFAIGDAEPAIVAVGDFDAPLRWDSLPPELHAHHARVVAGEAIWAAWNVSFDRAIWNYATLGFPELEPRHVIDVMAQATASGLAPDLAKASQQAGGERKLDTGKSLIKLFCYPASVATPQSHPEQWQEFCHYAGGDISSMRDVFLRTRQLPLAEWKEFWTSEKINQRGISVDLEMVKHAAVLAAEDKRRSAIEIPRLTAGAVGTVNQVAKMSAWLLRSLPPPGREILVKREQEVAEDGAITKAAKYSLIRSKVEKLIAFCQTQPELAAQQRVLELRLYGGSKSSSKFARMLQQQVNGKLYGQFVFSGAPQTGRYSSKGTQLHNLNRKALAYEYQAIEAILANCSYDELAELGDDTPVARKLALLLRPSFIAPQGRVFVWSDWSQIEARILPWLAGDDQGARERLQIFRDVDANPKLPDLYVRTAAALSDVAIFEVDKAMRQQGKIAELSLGYAAGFGALQNMAANYGLYFSDEEAKRIVADWRNNNQWAVDFWNGMWDAVEQAMMDPGVMQQVGRIHYVYLNGDLLGVLPSGRVLTYRNAQYESVEDLDEDDQPTGNFSTHLRCSRGHVRIKLWRGHFVENATQACAADFLRGTLCRLDAAGFDVCAHVHDECLVECDEDRAKVTARILRDVMLRGFNWSEGLPLMSEETIAPYYSKSEF